MKIKNIFIIGFLFCGSLAFAQNPDTIWHEFQIPEETKSIELIFKAPDSIKKLLTKYTGSLPDGKLKKGKGKGSFITSKLIDSTITYKIDDVTEWRKALGENKHADTCFVGKKEGKKEWQYFGKVLFTVKRDSIQPTSEATTGETTVVIPPTPPTPPDPSVKNPIIDIITNYPLYAFSLIILLISIIVISIIVNLIKGYSRKKKVSKEAKETETEEDKKRKTETPTQGIDFTEILKAISDSKTEIQTAINDSKTVILSKIALDKTEKITEQNGNNVFSAAVDEKTGVSNSPQQPRQIRYFSSFDDNKRIAEQDIKEDSSGRLFKIEIAGQEAIYSINDDKKAKKYALENFQQILKSFVKTTPDSTSISNSQGIITVEKGKLLYDQNQGKWFIDELVVIKII
jgi:hypothetical protein